MDEDLQLIKHIQAGSGKAFNRLFSKYNNYVYAIAYRLVLDHDDALDISQEVFLRIFQYIEGYSERGKFKPWLSRVTVNESLRFLRKKQHAMTAIYETAPEMASKTMTSPPTKSQLNGSLEQAMRKLSPQQRTVLELKYFEDMTLKEIADFLGLAPGTVKAHLSRALSHVRRALNPGSSSVREDCNHETL